MPPLPGRNVFGVRAMPLCFPVMNMRYTAVITNVTTSMLLDELLLSTNQCSEIIIMWLMLSYHKHNKANNIRDDSNLKSSSDNLACMKSPL